MITVNCDRILKLLVGRQTNMQHHMIDIKVDSQQKKDIKVDGYLRIL